MLPLALLTALAAPTAPPADADFFEANVRPVLANTCVRCHGPDKQAGGLRLDSRAAVLAGGDSGPAAVPNKPGESLLVKAIRRADGVAPMPPDRPLDPAAARAFERWVSDGLTWPAAAAPVRAKRHWSFEPVRAVEPPAGGHPVDAFLDVKLRETGTAPAPPADRLTLLRRATFDLTGLPPTPEEIDAFLADTSPAAFENLVGRLLASPAYGERWGRYWLDVARYADTAGETADFPVPDAWRYRNYVIAAFNADKPFDQFVREQIAGDILAAGQPPGRHAELVTATGFLAVSRRFGFDIEKDHFLTIEDTLDTLGKGVLGLTVGCARCHDHKYDPISAADYYALYGIFESTRYPFPGCEKTKAPRDSVPLLPPGAEAALKALGGGIAQGPRAYAVCEGAAHDARLHKRGDPDVRGDAVPRRFLKLLGGKPVPAGGGSGRLALAGWLTDPANPLTARVMVNRVWQGHFGTGLVATPNDFGTRGAAPTHPELLDYLAAEFVKNGWSVKKLHRLVMTSAAYHRVAGDQFARRRLSAEEIRDALLAASGGLNRTPGGPHPFPPAGTWGFTQHGPFSAVYDTDRRSVYLMAPRLKRHPFLALFDGPDPNSSTAARSATTVPTQALYFLNDPFVHSRAAALAKELVRLPEPIRVDRACRLLYGRPAGDGDRRAAGRFLAAAGSEPTAAWAAWLRVMFASNEFVYVD